MIHDVVDSIKRTSDIMHTSPHEEGNNKELELELNKGLNDMKRPKFEMSSKMQKKFKTKTIQTFNAKKFDIEKSELKTKMN